MKRPLAALLGLTLAFTLTACGGNEEAPDPQEEATQVTETAEDPALTAARQEIADSGAMCAVGYLGVLPADGDLDGLLTGSSCLEAYPFLADCPVVTYEGTQVFCLIPRDRNATVTVQEYICNESNGYQEELGETLYEGQEGQPLVLVCNVSDVMPNLQVTLVEPDGAEMGYTPALELCGGTVFVPAGMTIYDISDYEQVSQQEAPAPAVDFTGSWEAYESLEGAQVYLKTTFGEDGSAQHICGYASSEVLSDYQGTWYAITENGTYPAGSIVLEMTDTMSGADFFGVYTITAESGTITLTHVSGDTLLYGYDGKGITFSPYVS